MRDIPEEMTDRLASGVTTFAHVWRVTRCDGDVFGFTDHDQGLIVDGVTCVPCALIGGAIEKSLGLSVDTASISGALNAEAVTESDLARGLWDGARVDVYRVDWREPNLNVHLFAGHIGEARRGVQAFEAELRGLQAPLNVPVGRVFSRHCDANVGDARCGVDLDAEIYRGEGVVIALIDARAFRVDGLEAFAEGWFARGRLAWDAGGVSEVSAHRFSGGEVVLEVLDAPATDLAPGASFVVTVGCDKRFATCRDTFANTANFRGFPHMPGNDAVQAGPVAGDALDGSSRFT